jgi:ribonuclease HI
MNLELSKISDWARRNKIRFNENKSKAMLMSCRKRKERKKIEIYVNNKITEQVNSIKYLGIIFDSKMTFREHVNHIEEKCKKLIFILAKSAKLTWGLKHEALKTIYMGGILPLILYGAPLWSSVLNKKCYRGKLIRIQRLINIKIAKAYRTVSNEALCVITGLIPINMKIDETVVYYEYVKGNGNWFDRKMEVKYWNHPAKVVEITAAQEENKHTIHVYTDGSNSEKEVGSGIAIFKHRNLSDTMKYRLNGRCSNNQAEQLAILKALEKLQDLDTNEKTAQVFTDSQITLDALKNRKNNTHLIEQIRTKVSELENQNWSIDFHWSRRTQGITATS